MNLAELLKKGEIKKVEEDSAFAKKLVLAAENSIQAAEDNLKMGHYDVCLMLCYNAMLNCGRALMAAKGYRASSDTHHIAVVNFCTAYLPPVSSLLVASFNKYRVRRHDIAYGEIETGSVGKSEAENAIGKAGEFLGIAKQKIKL